MSKSWSDKVGGGSRAPQRSEQSILSEIKDVLEQMQNLEVSGRAESQTRDVVMTNIRLYLASIENPKKAISEDVPTGIETAEFISKTTGKNVTPYEIGVKGLRDISGETLERAFPELSELARTIEGLAEKLPDKRPEIERA